MSRFAWAAWGVLLAAQAFAAPPSAPVTSRLVVPGPDGTLSYPPYTDAGDRIPDFSHAGYGAGLDDLPEVPVRETLAADDDDADDAPRIQAALDAVGRRAPDAAGFRGAVRLRKGRYELDTTLAIRSGGVVLRGDGADDDQTVLLIRGTEPRWAIEVGGEPPRWGRGGERRVVDDYVPVGATRLRVDRVGDLAAGDTVFVERFGNEAWIRELGMDRIPARPDGRPSEPWQPFALKFDRTITRVDGDRLTLDAPLCSSIDQRWGGGRVYRYDDAGRIERVGIENLRGVSTFDPTVLGQLPDGSVYFADERHAVGLVHFGSVRHAWARGLVGRHFAHFIHADRDSKWVTVAECDYARPVSSLEGSRRYPYWISGQCVLVTRCAASEARHALVFDSRVCGPNVFHRCRTTHDYESSEPHERWSVGGLYDQCEAAIEIQDRSWYGTGHGWAGANYVVWNSLGRLVCQQPPTAQNFAIGHVGPLEPGAFERPAGWIEHAGTPVAPASLYEAQLRARRER